MKREFLEISVIYRISSVLEVNRPGARWVEVACLHLLAGVPDRRCLEHLEELGMVACEAGFPVLTPAGASTVDAIREAEEAKSRDFGRSVIEEGERYRARAWHP